MFGAKQQVRAWPRRLRKRISQSTLTRCAAKPRSDMKKILLTLIALLTAYVTTARASFVGIEYEGVVKVPGWEQHGGGLLEGPVWYHFYKRQDNSHFVLMNWKLPRKPNARQGHFRVTDELLIPPI